MTHKGSETGCKTIDELIHMYKVKSHKWTDDGLIAIRKNYEWLYFGWSTLLKQYVQTGSTIHYQR
jgi:hypothetical protein